MEKKDILNREIRHVDITSFNAVPILEQYDHMAFQARNLARAAQIYDRMLADVDCSVILCLAGSIFSAGLKQVVVDLVRNNMVDAIVSTGALIVDQDFFEALGFRHYQGTPFADDHQLMEHRIDRIYDTYIDEDQLQACDMTVAELARELPQRPYSSREFIGHMGEHLQRKGLGEGSVILECYRREVPIFVPAFSDCSAGFGLVYHQWKQAQGDQPLSIDSVKDFLELTRIKVASPDTGLLMIGGGVPKNFAQDLTVCAEIVGHEVGLHKYAVQITVADERDGALSGSTLKEAHSWGKVGLDQEQMVYAEATLALPLLASYAYHKGSWKARTGKAWSRLLQQAPAAQVSSMPQARASSMPQARA